MVAGVIAKINMIPSITSSDALAIYNCLNASDYLVEHKLVQQIQDVVDERMMQPSASAIAQPSAIKPQQLLAVHNYLTASDWSKLQEPGCPLEDMKWIIIKRLMLLGIASLHEQTVKHSVALIVYLIQQQSKVFPSYESIHNIVNSFKGSFFSVKVQVTYSGITTYPATPSELPAALFAKAYAADDQPVKQEIMELANIVNHVPLRSTSKLLQKAGGSASSSSSHQPNQSGLTSQAIAAAVVSALQAYNGGLAAQAPALIAGPKPPRLALPAPRPEVSTADVKTPNATPSPSPTREGLHWGGSSRLFGASKSSESLGSASSSKALAITDVATPPADRISSEDYENAATQALLARTTKSPSSGAMKRPAAAPA
jgi:hypothetical protein